MEFRKFTDNGKGMFYKAYKVNLNSKKRIDAFVKLVLYLTDRNAMYGINSVDDIYFMILGYTFISTIDEKSPPNNGEISAYMAGFKKYVLKHYNISNPAFDWNRAIKFYSNIDKDSLLLFTKLFSEYYKEYEKANVRNL